jgi:hypothetical protein
MRATSAIAVLFGGFAAVAQTPKADDKPPPIAAKDLTTSVNNLKQIGLAFYDFVEQAKVMPVDVVDKKGSPLLSWRVAILPQLGHEKLFKEFKLDEPWDSEHNKKLVAKIPKIYAPVRVKAEPGATFYQTFTGKDALFEPGNLLVKLPDSIPDGTVNTGLVFEAGEPVVWTKPADLPFDAKKALPKLGGVFDGQCHVLMCDGTILRLKKDRDEQTMKHLVMPNDGQAIDLDGLLK